MRPAGEFWIYTAIIRVQLRLRRDARGGDDTIPVNQGNGGVVTRRLDSKD